MGKGIEPSNNNATNDNNNPTRTELMQSRDELTKQRVKRLKIVLVMVSSYLAVEVIGGILTGSLALIADAGHMLADAGGIPLALFAVSFTRKSPTPHQM